MPCLAVANSDRAVRASVTLISAMQARPVRFSGSPKAAFEFARIIARADKCHTNRRDISDLAHL
jgi:hypothetical protein